MMAMALLACGESVARAQDPPLNPPLKIPEPPSKPKPPEPLAAFDAVRAAWHGFEPYDPEDVPIMATPPTRPKVKPRSNSGQRRAAAKRWWIK